MLRESRRALQRFRTVFADAIVTRACVERSALRWSAADHRRDQPGLFVSLVDCTVRRKVLIKYQIRLRQVRKPAGVCVVNKGPRGSGKPNHETQQRGSVSVLQATPSMKSSSQYSDDHSAGQPSRRLRHSRHHRKCSNCAVAGEING